MEKYEIFGLHDDQMERLSEMFGDAVLNKNADEGTMEIELADHAATGLVGEGFHLRRPILKK